MDIGDVDGDVIAVYQHQPAICRRFAQADLQQFRRFRICDTNRHDLMRVDDRQIFHFDDLGQRSNVREALAILDVKIARQVQIDHGKRFVFVVLNASQKRVTIGRPALMRRKLGWIGAFFDVDALQNVVLDRVDHGLEIVGEI